MIITREKLIKLAAREAENRAAQDDILSAYVIGSVASGEPLLGGAADIDLVLIHQGPPLLPREVVQLSDDVHFDITHHPQSRYESPVELRHHPWLGPAICEPVFLYDPKHFFEWVQAGVRGRFYQAMHVHARGRAFLRRARRRKANLRSADPWLADYLITVLEGINAAACLAGPPAAGRRMLLQLEQRAASLEANWLVDRFLELLGASFIERTLADQFAAWARAYDDADEVSSDPEFHPSRRDYYLRGFQALADEGKPEAALWTLLSSWDRCLRALGSGSSAEEHRTAWRAFLTSLNLSPEHTRAREDELEEFLDSVEILLDSWAEANGA